MGGGLGKGWLNFFLFFGEDLGVGKEVRCGYIRLDLGLLSFFFC